MTQRHLHLAAYDSLDARRRGAMLKLLHGFARGGQKSAYEVELGEAERHELLRQVAALIDPHADRFCLVRLDPRGAVLGAGRGAGAGGRRDCFYVG